MNISTSSVLKRRVLFEITIDRRVNPTIMSEFTFAYLVYYLYDLIFTAAVSLISFNYLLPFQVIKMRNFRWLMQGSKSVERYWNGAE